jgi:tRNA(fMet)-specific endonuclease VapC
MKFLLDTNICIYIIKNKPPQVFEKFLTLEFGTVGIFSITLAELNYGVAKSTNIEKNQEALLKFLTPIEILDFNFEAAEEYGKIRSDLEKKGTTIGSLDLLIAAHAKSLNTVLVTNNESEFSRVIGLKIENWAN